MDNPLPEDWEDLPEELKRAIEPHRWPEAREMLNLVAQSRLLLERLGTTLARNAGDDLARWKEQRSLHDAVRRLQVMTHAFSLDSVGRPSLTREVMADALEDLRMEITVFQTGVDTRLKTQQAYTLEHWARLPSETLSEEIRAQVKQWNEGERERILGQLPLEIRRRIEAGEPPAPEWIKPQ